MYHIYDLKYDGMECPVGVTDRIFSISWRLASDEKECKQIQYEVYITDENDKLIYKSELINTSVTRHLVDLSEDSDNFTSGMKYTFQIRSTSNTGEEAVAASIFSTGNLDRDWSAKWIEATAVRKPITDCTEMWKIFAGIVTSAENPEIFLNPAVNLRKKFMVGSKLKKAFAYATAHGVYELYVNGTLVSELLAPGYTTYSKYLEVGQYDVTELLNSGDENILAVTLADGWYTGKVGLPGVGNQYGDSNAFFLQLDLEYEDGRKERIVTDKSFKWHESELEYADLFVGVRERQNYFWGDWKGIDFDDSDWKPVVEKDYPLDNLIGRKAEPVVCLKRITPKVYETSKGELIIDAGENIVGVVDIAFRGNKDTVLKMTHSETLDRDGNFLMNIMGQNKNQTDTYVCCQKGNVKWTPRLTYHGFQYVKIDGINKEDILKAEVQVYGTKLQKTGEFHCSNEDLNILQENIYRSQQGNMLSIPTDCPQRERAGWTGDMQVYAPTACFNMDVYSFLRKWLYNMRLEQLQDGQIPNIIPSMPSDKLVGNSQSEHICSAAWGDACLIVPYTLYMKYGDIRILEENFDMMLRWMQYVEKQAATSFLKPEHEYTMKEIQVQKYLWNTEFHFGDWLYPSKAHDGMSNPIETAMETKEYVASAYFAYTSDIMTKVCEELGKEEAHHYRELNKNIKWAFAKAYIDEKGHLPKELQGLYVLALAFNLYPDEKTKQAGIQQLVSLIQLNDNKLDTGFVSVPFLLDVLWDNGEKKLAYQLLFNKECPSWLYEVSQGASTVWESWNAILPDGTRTNSSYNHFAFGCVGDFIYRKILGLEVIEPGYKVVRIEPDLDCGLDYANGSIETPYGQLEIRWKKQAKTNALDLEVILPPGVTMKN